MMLVPMMKPKAISLYPSLEKCTTNTLSRINKRVLYLTENMPISVSGTIQGNIANLTNKNTANGEGGQDHGIIVPIEYIMQYLPEHYIEFGVDHID